MANRADNLVMQQRTVPTTHQRVTKEFYDTAEKDEYGVYRYDQGYTRDMNGHIISVSKDDIRKLMEKASRDEHIYICLPEYASSFTQTKLMRQDIEKIQHASDKHRPASIDIHHSTSIDDNPKNSHSMKSQPDFYTRAEIDQLIEDIYITMETTEERLDRRYDDICFPMDLSMSALISKI
ncbi:unnamed protein product [Brassica rapa]|uniref:Uncharacterized protein n=1 Tax=Brassica campestris TaxID=3711 RepID=A0A8D9H809_BRACM|nr:unnamed protein product [Brassica rapa]